MKYTQVEGSSLIAEIGYHAERKILALHFHEGGKYWYYDVPENDYLLFLDAESKGKHYNAFIKGTKKETKYKSFRMTGYVKDVEFDAVLIDHSRKAGTDAYVPFSKMCEQQGWDFIEAWDNSLMRADWLAMQDEEYREAVAQRVHELSIEQKITELGF